MSSEFLQSLAPLTLEQAVSLEPEELAGYMLELLNRHAKDEGQPKHDYFTGNNYICSMLDQAHRYEQRPQRAVVEAWTWLESAGLNYEDVTGIRCWTPNKVIGATRELANQGVPLNSTCVEEHYYSRFRAAINRFPERWGCNSGGRFRSGGTQDPSDGWDRQSPKTECGSGLQRQSRSRRVMHPANSFDLSASVWGLVGRIPLNPVTFGTKQSRGSSNGPGT